MHSHKNTSIPSCTPKITTIVSINKVKTKLSTTTIQDECVENCVFVSLFFIWVFFRFFLLFLPEYIFLFLINCNCINVFFVPLLTCSALSKLLHFPQVLVKKHIIITGNPNINVILISSYTLLSLWLGTRY